MPAAQSVSPPETIDSLVRTAETLPPDQFTALYQRLTQVRDRLVASPDPVREAELMRRINERLPERTRRRHRRLATRLNAEKITPEELEEFRLLQQQVEQDHVRRLEWVMELAGLRRVPFETLLRQLNLLNTDVLG